MNPSLRRFAQRLIAYEAGGKKPSETEVAAAGCPAAFSAVYEQLRESLAMLMGDAGLHALLSRALIHGKKEVPWLGKLQITADGFLECPKETAQLREKEIREGEVVFLSQILELLAVFIGTAVTLHLVQAVWPGASIKEMES